MTPAIRDLLDECRRNQRAQLSLLEVEAQQRPERRTADLAARTRELVRRIEEVLAEAEDVASEPRGD